MSTRCDGHCRRPGQECVRPRVAHNFFSSKQRKDILVADVRQHAIMREGVEVDYQEHQEIFKCMNRTEKGLLTTMERKQKIDE